MAKKQSQEPPEFYKPAEIAKKLRVDMRVIYGMIDRGELPVIKVGRVFRIPATAVEELLAGGRKPAVRADAEPEGHTVGKSRAGD